MAPSPGDERGKYKSAIIRADTDQAINTAGYRVMRENEISDKSLVYCLPKNYQQGFIIKSSSRLYLVQKKPS